VHPACVPCLTEVAVDGVTITGNGTEADPLVAVGGGGGTPLITKEEGTNVSTNTTTLNFTGAGVTASLTSPGVVEVNVPGGGGAVGTLQEVTDLGNSTTNDIDFIANAGLYFDNGAFFRKGTTDAGNGGAKGTAQICSISYELKWEAGRLYYMQQDGFTIRDVTHNFTLVPQVTDDSSKGFVVGSRWSLDDGTVYLCSDDTIGAAVWAVVTVGGVTSVTGTAPIASSGGATPDISITQADGITDGYLTSTDWNTFDGNTTSYRLANPDVPLSGDVRGLSDFPYYMPTKFSFATNTVYNARAYLCKKANATDCRLDLNTPNGNIIAYSENYRFTVTDQGACSSTIYESPGEAVRTSTNPYQDTALSDLYDQALEQCDQYGSDIPVVGGIVTGICRVLITLTIPSQGSFDKLVSLRAAVANKPPFAYFGVFSTTISSLESATSTASVISTSSASFVSNVQAYTNFNWYQTYLTIIRALLWVAFAFGIYKFFKHFTPNS